MINFAIMKDNKTKHQHLCYECHTSNSISSFSR